MRPISTNRHSSQVFGHNLLTTYISFDRNLYGINRESYIRVLKLRMGRVTKEYTLGDVISHVVFLLEIHLYTRGFGQTEILLLVQRPPPLPTS